MNTAFAYNTGSAGYINKTFTQDERGQSAHGEGSYTSRAYSGEIVTLCEWNGVTLTQVTDSKTRYRLYMDGELTATYDDRKTAENMFVDFADISKKKLKAIMKLAA